MSVRAWLNRPWPRGWGSTVMYPLMMRIRGGGSVVLQGKQRRTSAQAEHRNGWGTQSRTSPPSAPQRPPTSILRHWAQSLVLSRCSPKDCVTPCQRCLSPAPRRTPRSACPPLPHSHQVGEHSQHPAACLSAEQEGRRTKPTVQQSRVTAAALSLQEEAPAFS